VNGRVAMLGFVGIMLAEHGSKTPALEQFGDDVLGIALLSLAITLGSLFPKFASGSSLKVRLVLGADQGPRCCAPIALTIKPIYTTHTHTHTHTPQHTRAHTQQHTQPQDLHAAATGANLKAEGVIGALLGLFDTNVELWSGRLAMIGIVGTLLVEGVTGSTLL